MNINLLSLDTTTTALAGMLMLCQSLVAAVDNRHADVRAPLELACELAERTGEGNAYWMGFGPTNVGCWRMHAALEIGDHESAAAIAETCARICTRIGGSQAL